MQRVCSTRASMRFQDFRRCCSICDARRRSCSCSMTASPWICSTTRRNACRQCAHQCCARTEFGTPKHCSSHGTWCALRCCQTATQAWVDVHKPGTTITADQSPAETRSCSCPAAQRPRSPAAAPHAPPPQGHPPPESANKHATMIDVGPLFTVTPAASSMRDAAPVCAAVVHPCIAVQDALPVLRQSTIDAGGCVAHVHLHAAQLVEDGVG